MLSELAKGSEGLIYQIIAIDPLEPRRSKMEAVYSTIHSTERASGRFIVASIEDGKKLSAEWTSGLGCNAVLEVHLPSVSSLLGYKLTIPLALDRREPYRTHAVL